MFRTVLLLLLLLPYTVLAQFTITGRIIHKTDQKTLSSASVFLSNTTIGTVSAEDGAFTLYNVKSGNYTLTITMVGFETHIENIFVNKDIALPDIALVPKVTELHEVVIHPDKDRAQNYAIFKRELLGPSEFATQCKILNPDVVDLTNVKNERTLKAKTDGALEIENNALGYRLHYTVNEFTYNYGNNSFYYQWSVLFEELKGSPSQERKWAKNRLKAYLGSAEHYFRSILGERTEAEGFTTLTLVKKPNSLRLPDSLISAKIRQFHTGETFSKGPANDSLNYWLEKARVPKMMQYLINKPLHPDSLTKLTEVKGLFALGFKSCLYIIYKGKIKDADAFGYQNIEGTTVITLDNPYLYFDRNGVVANLYGVTYEGDWGRRRVSELLPIDYQPPEKK